MNALQPSKKDFKRVKSSPRHRKDIEQLLSAVLLLLVSDIPLPENDRDHALTGNWVGYRECHIKPDLLLVYKKVVQNILRLARIGSHSQLFR